MRHTEFQPHSGRHRNTGPFVLDFLGSTSLGKGFDSAQFQVFDNGNLLFTDMFANSSAAQLFFASGNALDFQLAGLNNIELAFNEMMSGGNGFSFQYAAASVSAAPLPPSWTLMLIGLAGLGFVAYRRKSKPAALMAA